MARLKVSQLKQCSIGTIMTEIPVVVCRGRGDCGIIQINRQVEGGALSTIEQAREVGETLGLTLGKGYDSRRQVIFRCTKTRDDFSGTGLRGEFTPGTIRVERG